MADARYKQFPIVFLPFDLLADVDCHVPRGHIRPTVQVHAIAARVRRRKREPVRGHLASPATRAAPVRCDSGTERRGDPRDDHLRPAAAASPGFFMAAATASPGFFTQEEARATAAVAARNEYVEDVADGSQAVEEEAEEEEQATQVEVADANLSKGKKKRKKDSPPAEPRIKWTPKEEECLAEAWMTVSMNDITGANQSFDIKWHGVQEEIKDRPISGHDLEQKLRRALDMYMDDTGMQFKFLNVYARIEKCEKWAETRKTLSKSKTEQYNPDAPAAGSAEGRP
ncbi:hypothetical protein QYE76_021360 [Lolium multiflorum]|uniref:Myb-like domain-containing protein n=1 Tax=Lolium multiflorum TaxID=4521 RepID=A0AAD8VT07_LOLMU|nr:hypothetical protein QYE76_021360 [Lolium multiflorum]